MNYIASESLYLTADHGRIVKEGDPAAAARLVSRGATLPTETVERFGLKTNGRFILEIVGDAIIRAVVDEIPKLVEAAVDAIVDLIDGDDDVSDDPASEASDNDTTEMRESPTPKPKPATRKRKPK